MFRSKGQAAAWLAGIIDGEGSVAMRSVKGTQGFAREVRITNTSERLLDAVREALDLLGVPHTTYDRSERERLGSKPIFDLVVSRKENLELLLRVLPLRSEKADQLKASVESYIRPGKPPREELLALVEAGLSDKQIAEKYGVTPGAPWYWRKSYGIVRGG